MTADMELDQADSWTKLTVKVEKRPHLMIVRIQGNASHEQIAQMEAELQPVLAQAPRIVVLDLGGLTGLCSLFLGALVRFRAAIARYKGDVLLANLQPETQFVFTATRLDELFLICESQV